MPSKTTKLLEDKTTRGVVDVESFCLLEALVPLGDFCFPTLSETMSMLVANAKLLLQKLRGQSERS